MDINPLAVIISGISNMIVGFIWYGPLFAKPWMKYVGLTEKDIKNGPGIGYLFTLIASFICAAVTSYIINRLDITDLIEGGAIGLMLGIGYVGTTFMTNYIFAKKSFKLYFIDAGYQILMITIAGVICTLFN